MKVNRHGRAKVLTQDEIQQIFNHGLENTKINETQTNKKPPVINSVEQIVNAIMIYNEEQTLVTNRAVPAYGLINKISERYINKTVAKATVDKYMNANREKLHDDLEALEIPGGLYNSQWNGKWHRKTMNIVIDSIVSILNQR